MYRAYFYAAHHKNTARGTYAFVVEHRGVEVHHAERIVHATSQTIAEYCGLIGVLQWICENDIKYITIATNARTAVMQAAGRLKCHDDALWSYKLRAQGLITKATPIISFKIARAIHPRAMFLTNWALHYTTSRERRKMLKPIRA